MKQLKAKIIEHKSLAQGFYKMRLESVYLAKNSKPGQFIEIKCSKGHEVLLRRPLGVHRILNGGIEVLYEVVGKGTELLSCKRPGDTIDVMGPLGNGFTLPRTTHDARRTTILIAGGMGVAPLVALAEIIVSRLAGEPAIRLKVLMGACKKERILCEKDFKKLGAEVLIATEDGSKGHKGLITDLLSKELSRHTGTPAHRQTTIYACGPAAMLKTVAKIAEAKRVPCQVSMEEHMACGVGVCLGCPVKVKIGGYKMVCKDGPVFSSKEIAW